MELPKKIDGHIESDDDDLPMMTKDWAKADRSVKNEGFRMGLEASQEQSLQIGFNAAFKEALQMALAGGKLQGGICANLSYIPNGPQIPGFTMPILQPQGINNQNAAVPTHGSLQQLLSSNTELISSIPTLLNSGLLQNVAPQLNQEIQGEPLANSVNLCTEKNTTSEAVLSTNQDLGCMAVGDQKEVKHSGESQTQDQSSSCVDVCNNRSSFWNQLESFKVQAETLGVISANE